MKHVWILLEEHVEDPGFYILGVFLTFEGAKKRKQELENENRYNPLHIEKWEVEEEAR
jgi:hypothetical protein